MLILDVEISETYYLAIDTLAADATFTLGVICNKQ